MWRFSFFFFLKKVYNTGDEAIRPDVFLNDISNKSLKNII